MGLRFDCDALTHEGRVRTNNEDAYAVRPSDGLFVVADGMGGHENGEWASAAIAEAIRTVALPDAFDTAWSAVGDAIHAANATVWAEAQERGLQMGSTCVALLVRGTRFATLWVGDSRCYLARGGQLYRLTSDHTQVQEMIDRGMLTPEAAVGHPMGHVLARAVGVQPTVEVDVVSDEIEPGDVFLLCSDGLTARVKDDEINRILSTRDADDRVRDLVELTLARGAPDNVTVIAVGAAAATAAFQTLHATVQP